MWLKQCVAIEIPGSLSGNTGLCVAARQARVRVLLGRVLLACITAAWLVRLALVGRYRRSNLITRAACSLLISVLDGMRGMYADY